MTHKPRKPSAVHEPVSVSASTFKATCLELMDEVASTGRDVIVTKHGRPVVRVSPAGPVPVSPWGFLAGSIAQHGDIVTADQAVWESSSTDPLRNAPRNAPRKPNRKPRRG